MKKQISFFLIIIFAFLIRFYGINWDSGFHLHPDERMIIIVAERINFFDQLNPQFFNYGTLPLYLLKGVAQLLDFIFQTNLANYNGLLLLGRFLSVTFDLLTITFIYKTAQLLSSYSQSLITNIAIFSSFFYAIAFFPIQNSHFFTVDIPLTSLTTILIYYILKYFIKPFGYQTSKNSFKPIILIGIIFAAMMATKFTSIIFLPLIWAIIILRRIKIKYSGEKQPLRLFFFKIAIDSLTFHFTFLTFKFLFMPYAFLDYKKFLNDVLLQLRMNNNPYIFPYTLQYVGTLPYFYYLKNIFLWGLGPIISLLSLIGLISFFDQIPKIKNYNNKSKYKKFLPIVFYITWYLYYFLIIGGSAVKFMRYMLPIYPFLAIMAALGINKIQKVKFKILNFKILVFLLLVGSSIWLLLFLNIYSQPNTRLSATHWILKNIPSGSTLAVEHWDDKLPLYGQENYQYVEMALYDQPDDKNKWVVLNEKLKMADYIIIASNRLYIPLQKLTNCQKYKVCYPKTSNYYQKLFTEQLDFKKVAEFAIYPTLSILNFKLSVNDQSADESFTVYDHPKVMIFKKTNF